MRCLILWFGFTGCYAAESAYTCGSDVEVTPANEAEVVTDFAGTVALADSLNTQAQRETWVRDCLKTTAWKGLCDLRDVRFEAGWLQPVRGGKAPTNRKLLLLPTPGSGLPCVASAPQWKLTYDDGIVHLLHGKTGEELPCSFCGSNQSP